MAKDTSAARNSAPHAPGRFEDRKASPPMNSKPSTAAVEAVFNALLAEADEDRKLPPQVDGPELAERLVIAALPALYAERDRQIRERLRARFAQHLASTIDADLAAAHAKGTTPATAALQVAVAALDHALSGEPDA